MSVDEELERWSAPGSEAPAGLRDLLNAGRADVGSSHEVARLAAGLREALGASAGLPAPAPRPAAPSAPSPASMAGTARLWRWLAGATFAGLALWGLMHLRSRDEAATAPSAPPPAAPSATVELGVPSADVVAPVPAPPAESTPPPVSTPPKAAPKPSASPSPRPAARAKAPALSEAELLQRAQAALGADPARALALTAEHQKHFPRGGLAQEREVIAIEALKRLGRGQAADERAAAFEERYRGSVHRSRLREGEGTPPAPTQNR